jgi:hypothetical protein
MDHQQTTARKKRTGAPKDPGPVVIAAARLEGGRDEHVQRHGHEGRADDDGDKGEGAY